jgi:leader peptidase (prepilin peptidase)/N-methyltransferase
VLVLLVVLACVLGLAVGSFLNVVIYRVPRGESLVRPSSHCPSCNQPIAPYDNIPVVSWLLLRGRCRRCGERISVRYPAVELLTAVLFGAMAARLANEQAWAIPAYLFFAAIGVALAAIDLDVKRLPDVLTLPSYPVMGGLLLVPAIAYGSWSTYLHACLYGLALYAFYLVLRIIYPPGMGYGDVKFSGVVGLALGWFGWRVLIVGGFLGFLLGGLIGAALMVAGRAGRKSRVPFGPFMIAGAFIGVLWGTEIADWYTGLLG